MAMGLSVMSMPLKFEADPLGSSDSKKLPRCAEGAQSGLTPVNTLDDQAYQLVPDGEGGPSLFIPNAAVSSGSSTQSQENQPQADQPQSSQSQENFGMDGVHDHEGDWAHGFCSCCGDQGVFWGACCCGPCLFGRTGARLKKFPTTNKDELSFMNADCGILCLASYLSLGFLPIMLKRQDMRERWGIKGNGFGDCCASFWCHVCVLSQMEREVKDRARADQQNGGYGSGKAAGYAQPPPQMMYQPPQQG